MARRLSKIAYAAAIAALVALAVAVAVYFPSGPQRDRMLSAAADWIDPPPDPNRPPERAPLGRHKRDFFDAVEAAKAKATLPAEASPPRDPRLPR